VHGFPSPRAEVVARLMSHIGGHPYFVRSLLHAAASSGRTLEQAVAELDEGPGSLGAPLERMFQRCRLWKDEALRGTVLDIAAGRPRPLDHLSYRRLADAGLVVGKASQPELRIPIAARVLRRE
jgi:hypothetical protein